MFELNISSEYPRQYQFEMDIRFNLFALFLSFVPELNRIAFK